MRGKLSETDPVGIYEPVPLAQSAVSLKIWVEKRTQSKLILENSPASQPEILHHTEESADSIHRALGKVFGIDLMWHSD